jgi:hypothetical protein
VSRASANGAHANAKDGYVLPVLRTRIPEKVVHAGFWGGLLGAVVVGAVDPPLAALVGVGVIVARHRRKQ